MAFISSITQKLVYQRILQVGGAVIGILILAWLGIKIGDALIDRIFKPRDQKLYPDEKRVLTLRTLARSILRYAIYFVVGFSVLVQIAGSINNLKGLLAGAGILGLAVGFGAQSLMKDVITGFFILLEDQYSVGEYVTTGNFSGFVEEIGLRVTKLRDWGGEYHIVPNGQITAITNFSRGSMRALVDVGIAYEQDIGRALEVMQRIAQGFREEMSDIIVEGPEVLGVIALGPSEVVIRTIAKVKPMEQWRVERELRKRFKETFEREGIEIPHQRLVVINSGSADNSRPQMPKVQTERPGGDNLA